MGWDFSLDDMHRLGIGDISIEDGTTWEPVFPVTGQQIYRIQLDALPDFQPQGG
jgi:hypothetical protein